LKVLVTGGAGFIGSHLSEELLRLGHQVIIVDELNDFYAPELKRANLASIEALSRSLGREAGTTAFYPIDICNREAIFRIVDEHRPEAIIHLAARAGVRPSLAEPFLYEQVNVHGTLVLLEAARKAGTKKFVFASSSSVYGISSRVPFTEDDPLHQPISPYAATKIAGEKLCFTYSHLYNLPVAALRFFTVYGPRQRPDLAIRKFTDLIDQGQSITAFGDGASGRDYTFIADIVQGIVSALLFDCKFEVFNLGNSHPVRLQEMIQVIEEAVGKKADVRWVEAQPGDVPITFADISKAQKLLRYQPLTKFADGVKEFVRWYRATHVAA